jgi:hypothetical protein
MRPEIPNRPSRKVRAFVEFVVTDEFEIRPPVRFIHAERP